MLLTESINPLLLVTNYKLLLNHQPTSIVPTILVLTLLLSMTLSMTAMDASRSCKLKTTAITMVTILPPIPLPSQEEDLDKNGVKTPVMISEQLPREMDWSGLVRICPVINHQMVTMLP